MNTQTIFAALAISVVSIAPALAAGPRYDQQGVYRFPYGTSSAPLLQCSPDRVCELILEQGETIYDKVAGDTVRWIIADGAAGGKGSAPAIFFKPTDLGTKNDPMDTNLIVTTNKRTYEVRLAAVASTPRTRYGFFYGDQLAVGDAEATDIGVKPNPTPQPGSDAVPPQLLDFSYHIVGNAEYRPQQVWNDGVHTYLKLPPDSVSPSIYTVLVNGQLNMINYHPPINNVYTLDGTPNHIVLVGSTGRHIPRVEIYKDR